MDIRIWISVSLLLRSMTLAQKYSYDNEGSLRELLFTTNGYNKLSRPSDIVHVDVSLNVVSLTQLSIRDQTFSIAGNFILMWDDSRLTWVNESTYADKIRYIFSTDDHLWTPPIQIKNSVSDVGLLTGDGIPMRIDKAGLVVWTLSGIFKTQCITDSTYYPFDKQICEVILSTLGYTNTEITLRASPWPYDFSEYRENGEWDYVSSSADAFEISKNFLTFSELSFMLMFQRRPYYHIMNTIVPMNILASLSVLVFRLPCESGEKMGYSLTVLLAFAVYLTVVSGDLPTTSVNTSILSLYLILMLTLGVASVLLTVIVLNCHNEEDNLKPFPNWLKKIVCIEMMKDACYKNRKCTCRSSKIKVKDSESSQFEIKDIQDEPQVKSWKCAAKILDKVFFRIYLVILMVLNTVCLLLLVLHYYIG